MRNSLVQIPPKGKDAFAKEQKQIWLAPVAARARERAAAPCKKYAARYPKAVETLGIGLEDSLTFYALPQLDHRKVASTNMLERLNKEIRRRTSVVGIVPNSDSYVHLTDTYLMEYSEDRSVSHAYIRKHFQADGIPAAA